MPLLGRGRACWRHVQAAQRHRRTALHPPVRRRCSSSPGPGCWPRLPVLRRRAVQRRARARPGARRPAASTDQQRSTTSQSPAGRGDTGSSPAAAARLAGGARGDGRRLARWSAGRSPGGCCARCGTITAATRRHLRRQPATSGSPSPARPTRSRTSPTPSTACSSGWRRRSPRSAGSSPTPRTNCARRWRPCGRRWTSPSPNPRGRRRRRAGRPAAHRSSTGWISCSTACSCWPAPQHGALADAGRVDLGRPGRREALAARAADIAAKELSVDRGPGAGPGSPRRRRAAGADGGATSSTTP